MKAPRDTRIPRTPLLWLAAALLFTIPAMLGTLPIWVPGIFLCALAAKFWMEPRGVRLRSMIAKLVLAAVSLATIFATYGSVKGIEPGVSIIVMLMSIKILEAHTAREFQVMVMVAFVLCLCGFFLSQDLAVALCLLVAFTLLLVALIQFHRGSTSSFRRPLFAACKLMAQAAPLIVLLFLFFPRVSGGFRFQLGQTGGAGSGFSGQLSPGSVASLANSSGVAFRAEFPDGKIPAPNKMYWRGVVMWQCNGLEWRAPNMPAAVPRRTASVSGRETIRQWITIEPHDGHWMFALDWPVSSPPGATLAPGNYVWSAQTIRKTRRYEVRSLPAPEERELHARERKLLLQLPAPISPAVWSLVQSWTRKDPNPHAVVSNALEFFRTQGFRYSLSPGEYTKNDLDEFLLHRRLGFCEHYAASFATLMRLAGIPARVVTGYLGGEYNEIGHFFLVRQADAHAWCEVWFPDSGWERIDPTSVVAPDRVNLGLNSFLERREAAGQTQDRRPAFIKTLSRWPSFTKARLAWQTLSYAWDVHVLSFDADAQDSFFDSIGIGNRGPLSIFVTAAAIVITLLFIYAIWMRLRNRTSGDRVKTLYEMFCSKAARLGAARRPAEGPLDFSRRAAQLLPNESEKIQNILQVYVALRYSSMTDSRLLNQFALQVTMFGRPTVA
jgi:transglutaminase-like putative cysteine protease